MKMKLEKILGTSAGHVGRGLGTAYAAVLSVPLGFLQWMERDDYERYIRRILPNEDLTVRKALIASLEEDMELSKPSLCDYISGWYHNLKP